MQIHIQFAIVWRAGALPIDAASPRYAPIVSLAPVALSNSLLAQNVLLKVARSRHAASRLHVAQISVKVVVPGQFLQLRKQFALLASAMKKDAARKLVM
jgi:hypothetical protein